MKLDKILVPIDFSPSALEAASTALDLARPSGGRITLLHVIDVAIYDYGWMTQGMQVARDIIGKDKEKLRARLKALLTVDDESGVELETRILEGIPHREILSLTEELDPDLIVMGTHGRRGLSHLFMGSVAEKVVRLAPCPVLAVKAEGANDADSREGEDE